ncbi:hypothetical protein D3C85_1409090 [compost metagenome]
MESFRTLASIVTTPDKGEKAVDSSSLVPEVVEVRFIFTLLSVAFGTSATATLPEVDVTVLQLAGILPVAVLLNCSLRTLLLNVIFDVFEFAEIFPPDKVVMVLPAIFSLLKVTLLIFADEFLPFIDDPLLCSKLTRLTSTSFTEL